MTIEISNTTRCLPRSTRTRASASSSSCKATNRAISYADKASSIRQRGVAFRGCDEEAGNGFTGGTEKSYGGPRVIGAPREAPLCSSAPSVVLLRVLR